MASAELQDDRCDCGVKMEMLVGIDVIKGESGLGECRELRLYFRLELTTGVRAKEHRCACERHVGPKAAGAIDKRRDPVRREGRPPFNKDQMQSDSQAWIGPRATNGVLGRGRSDHQACRR